MLLNCCLSFETVCHAALFISFSTTCCPTYRFQRSSNRPVPVIYIYISIYIHTHHILDRIAGNNDAETDERDLRNVTKHVQ